MSLTALITEVQQMFMKDWALPDDGWRPVVLMFLNSSRHFLNLIQSGLAEYSLLNG